MSKVEIEVWYVIIGCSFLMLFFLAIFIFILVINQKKKMHALKTEKEKNEKEYLKSIQIQNDRIELILQERKRIAQDLHDSMGGQLAACKLLFSKASDELPALNNLNTYVDGLQHLTHATVEMREIAHNLMPRDFSELGLSESLQSLTETINKTEKIKIDYLNINFNTKLDNENELLIYRIIQELINNVIKHANAQNLLIQLNEMNNELVICIEDDGKGFDMSLNENGLGLKNIKNRLNILKGTTDITSTINEGTTVVLKIPLGNSHLSYKTN